MTDQNLPVTANDLAAVGLGNNMPMAKGLAVFFNEPLYQRCKQIAGVLAKAEGVTPRHLLNKPEACFAVISRSITWNLDPVAVMCSTYQTPNGAIGYEGKLVQAILENSGKLDGGVEYELFGPWEKVRGNFKFDTSAKGHKYAVAGWKDTDEKDIGVRVKAKVKGEVSKREESFFLETFWPRNSTLWALRPEQQIKYAACRAFANTVMPGVMMGIPFDFDPSDVDTGPMTDITPPKPTKSEFEQSPHRHDAKLQEWTARLNFAKTIDEVKKIHDDGGKELSPDVHGRWNEQCDISVEQFRRKAEADQAKATEAQPQESEEEAPPPNDDDWKHQWGDKLAAAKTLNDVADVRGAGIKELPQHLHEEWNGACDARAKTITTKKASKAEAKAAKEEERREPTPVPDSPALARGKRLLLRSITVEDVDDLYQTIADEISIEVEKKAWAQACEDRRQQVTS